MRRALSCLLLACALLLFSGCSNGEGSGDLCSISPSSSSQVFVAARLQFATVTNGVSEGFDLDGRVTDGTEPDPDSCNRLDFVSPDGTPGIDNQFSFLHSLLVDLVGDAVEGLIQMAVNDGSLLLMFQIDGIDDRQNDDCVNVRVFKGSGRPDLGTHGLIAPSQTFDVAEDSPLVETRGYIEDGVLHAGPFAPIIPIAIFQVFFDLRLHGGMLRADLHDDGTMTAVLGGGVETAQIVDVARMAAENDSTATSLLRILPSVLRSRADLALDPDSSRCTQLSAVMTIDGAPAYLYADSSLPTQ